MLFFCVNIKYRFTDIDDLKLRAQNLLLFCILTVMKVALLECPLILTAAFRSGSIACSSSRAFITYRKSSKVTCTSSHWLMISHVQMESIHAMLAQMLNHSMLVP